VDARRDEALDEMLGQLRVEVADQRARSRRLILAADADRRAIERELHERVQQQLVALAVDVQRLRQTADADPAAAKVLLDELAGEIDMALDETKQLAQRIYPPLLEAGGLVAALRAAAMSAGVRASLDVGADACDLPEVAATVYWCWLEVLEHAGGGGARATVTATVRDEEGAVAFEVAGASPRSDSGLHRLRDRVEALGGRLTIQSEPGRSTRVSGSLPLSR
jgi:signal transduction histidine kinase